MNFFASETEEPDDLQSLEIAFTSPGSPDADCNSFKWRVQLIDDDGNIEGKMVTTNEVWKLKNQKVIVHFDENTGQPIDHSGGLLGSWLGKLSKDVNLLPINYDDWRNVPSHIKDRAWDVIQAKFRFDDPELRKAYVISNLGSRCKDVKGRLWKDYKKDDRVETMQNRPKSVPEDQWCYFVDTRFTDKWKKMREKNVRSQSNNKTRSLCERKSIARRRNDIKIKTGKTPSRAELFIATRTKPDGSFVSEEAKTRVEELTTLMSQNPNPVVTSQVPATLDDEYAQVFGPERPGRVRCVGRGPTPSKLMRHTTIVNSETVELRTQVKTLQEQVKALSTLSQQIVGSGTNEQANTWAAILSAAIATLQTPTTSPQEIGNGTNGNQNV